MRSRLRSGFRSRPATSHTRRRFTSMSGALSSNWMIAGETPPAAEAQAAPVEEHLDPRRWITLGIVVMAVLIAAIDGTVLNVAIPTILRDFHTTLPSLQWVITGYS